MNKYAVLIPIVPLLVAANVPSSPDLGKAEAKCRPGETGPALLVTVAGLKDRRGNIKLEVYPSNDKDFLQDDNVLINEGKTFRRVEVPVPATDPVVLCARIPGPGAYSVSVLHDRDGNRRFGWTVDGIGFSGNPRLGWSKPKAEKARVIAGAGLTRLTVVMNYRHGLGVAPLKQDR
ncbi:MAG: DUF2141 domain-containing protein [Sphingomonadales bacterium]|nr:DUF2141 domain-containing protein [Sphingomonadales bacterium]MDE2568505.1 DUF2141 domain-containing protein [Sphingomonadales bacterium]